MKPMQGYINSKIKTKSQPETIWHVEETPRRSGISACPISLEDLSSQPFLMEKWDRERHIQFDQGVPVKLPNNKIFLKERHLS